MIFDTQGNSLTGATEAAATAFEQAVRAFNIYRGDPVARLDEAIAEAPRFAMAHLTKAALYALATEPAAAAEARAILGHARTLRMDEREASFAAAIDHVLRGDWTAGAVALDHHNIAWPHDLVALQCGHLIDFYRANARNLRDRIARVLPKWSADRPGYSIVLGFHSFGLEETGDYAFAEARGREACEREPLDAWAHHAVAHVLEMQGRAAEGVQWMTSREPHWSGDGNFIQVHNWWHRALCHIDLGETAEALALYDAPIRGGLSAVALDLVDASALLWRLAMEGVDVGDRWQELASAWDAHADGELYAFNDWHAAMAWLGAGRAGDVDVLLRRYRENSATTEAAGWARGTGHDLIAGFAAFWRGDHAEAAEKLFRARHIANAFGGSHAQRDIIDWTLTEAALRGKIGGLAEAMANERLTLKPHSPVNRRFLSRASALPMAAE